MKRSTILQPLSREHHTTPALAKSCERAALSGDGVLVSSACQRVIRAYANELEPHFKTEEASLLPLLHGNETQLLAMRTLADHQLLRGLIDALRQNDAGSLGNFGKCLSAHVRFEERELFPVLEGLL
ncbi:MAG: hemerythrin domain-containing protein [Pseudomonadota bacterium]